MTRKVYWGIPLICWEVLGGSEHLCISYGHIVAIFDTHNIKSNGYSYHIFHNLFYLLDNLVVLVDCRCLVLWCDAICDVGRSIPI